MFMIFLLTIKLLRKEVWGRNRLRTPDTEIAIGN
jgi:hypothetical protein